jgi:hypothetical protein
MRRETSVNSMFEGLVRLGALREVGVTAKLMRQLLQLFFWRKYDTLDLF